ncbi:MAG TPA: NEW3 domain-containing protein [Thermoanaerobaculia bacterium]|nr:NEW3 domain-containing protein [Thermoanaerobaculia bacterium]
MRIRTALFLALLIAAGMLPALGQDRTTAEQSRIIEVRRRQVDLQSVRSELARKQQLFEQGLLPGAELESVRARLAGAELDYQEAVLALLNLEPRVSVRRALKSQARDGRRLVELTIVNLTAAFDDSQWKLLSNFDGSSPIATSLRNRALRDLFVSVRDTGSADASGRAAGRGIAIALPYELHVPELRYGESRTLRFELLRDLDSILVGISHKGQTQEIELQLEQAATGEVAQVTSTQISQEADLGGQATFDLRLERSTVDVRTLQLKALNLPRQVSYSFLDPQGEARVSQINFSAGVRQQNLKLRLFLPDRSDASVKIDEPLVFWVVALESGEVARFAENRTYTPEEISGHRAGSLRLELTPRGVGRIELAAGSLFAETDPGKSVETTFKLRNTGTRRLDNVQLAAEAPTNWRVELTPDSIPALDTHSEQDVRLTISAPADADVGDYEMRIMTQSYAYNRQVPAEDKIFRVSVKARSRLWMAAGVLTTLLLLAVGILVSGMKLARR